MKNIHNNINPLIFSISGKFLTQEEIILFKESNPFGFILFARNIESKEQILELTESLRNLFSERKVYIFIDQEGGRVARIKPPISKNLYPSGEHFSILYEENLIHAKRELKKNYEKLTSELKSFGIDSPCAPVCDIFYPDSDEIIGDRSFGNQADKVINLCRSAIEGIEHSGGIAILKHLPGHGRAKVDSHYDLPKISDSIDDLEQTDFRVFQELAKEEKNVWGMTAHIVYECLDANLPVTLSEKAINYIRNNIGFKGRLLTDDISMYALHGEIGKKLSTLKRVIYLAQNNMGWKEKYLQVLKDLLDIDASGFGNGIIVEKSFNKIKEIKPDFLESLQKVTKMSLQAGCDLVLHCSGDLEEMKSIWIAYQEYKN